ncbi:MAG: adenosine-specific kinase [Candidatus Thermoplasmatota archaeon]|jgi:hypothetical protein|nr:adenosine-specific kinase [Candidatus Thermoplasmatota archaeon]
MVNLEEVEISFPEGCNVILGYSHFIKTVEDLTEIIETHLNGTKYAVAFSEASGKRLMRYSSNDEDLQKCAVDNLMKLSAGHTFLIILRNAFPIAILNAVKSCQEVGNVFAATANPLSVIVAKGKNGNGIMGVIDGFSPLGVETPEDQKARIKFLRDIGYKK